ncbi:cation channel sperm-associated protein 4-like [Saccoglossus kowalevskii]
MHFGNMGTAMYSLFICVTQDGWMGIFSDFKTKSEGDAYFTIVGGVYFFICILIGAFVFANLVVAVMVTNLDKAMKEVKEEKKMREDTLATESPKVKTDTVQEKNVPVISVQDVVDCVELSMQNPLHYGDFSHLTHEKYENFLLALSAIEDNLVKYKQLRNELDQIFEVIWDLNMQAIDEDHNSDSDNESSDSQPDNTTTSTPIPIDLIGKRGDILSNLMAMEKSNYITSKSANIGTIIQQSAQVIDKTMHGPMPSRSRGYINRAKFAQMEQKLKQKFDEDDA